MRGGSAVGQPTSLIFASYRWSFDRHVCTAMDSYTAKTDFLEQISNANLRFFIHPNFAFLSGPNKVDLRGISKLIEVK